MSGTIIGGRKTAKTNKERHGEDFYKKIGHLGGSVKGVAKGFALMPREKRQEAGRKGGKTSKRGPAKDDIDKAEEILERESGRD